MAEVEILRGACLCGAVRFEIDPPTRFCAHCHCSMCRRAHGAPLVTWSGVPDSQFRLIAGADLLRDYTSSPEATRSFCSRCGSTLLFRSTRWPGEVHVASANLDRLDRTPVAHVFFSDRAAWFECDDGLIKRGGASGLEAIES
ncbi:GFA family protein [Nannocystaceae bacterium ST9]